jgi:hypothetical protein
MSGDAREAGRLIVRKLTARPPYGACDPTWSAVVSESPGSSLWVAVKRHWDRPLVR